MAPNSTWMLILEDDRWGAAQCRADEVSAHDLQPFESDTLLERVREVTTAMKEWGYRGEPVLLAIDSRWCLTATCPAGSPAASANREALLFEMEQRTPWEAEEMTMDFVRGANGVFATAARTSDLAPWVEALDKSGMIIDSISPLALLAAAHFVADDPTPPWRAIAWASENQIDLVIVEENRLVDWRVIAAKCAATLEQTLKVLSLERRQPLPVVGCELDETLATLLETHPDLRFQRREEGPTIAQAAAQTARDVLNSKSRPWIEFRRGPLAAADRLRAMRGVLNLALVAACVFLMVLGSSFLVRAYRYDAMSELAAGQLRTVYSQVFPGEAPPAGVRSRLESELAKLKGMRGESKQTPAATPASEVMFHLLAALPSGLRFRIEEIRIDEGRLDLSGEVRNHADVDQIAAALREHGFEVAAPSTERASANSVAVRLSAQRIGSGKIAGK